MEVNWSGHPLHPPAEGRYYNFTKLPRERLLSVGTMRQPDFDPAPTTLRIHRCGYVSKCKKHHCRERATVIAQKIDVAGRHVRQIELCPPHCEIVIERERARELEICDRRNEIASLSSLSRESKKERADAHESAIPKPIGERG